MAQSLVLVRAWSKIALADVQALAPALQTQIDRDFLPAWQAHGATPVTVWAADIADIPRLDPASWPIFLNRHSTDAGALGWHDDASGRIFGRIFWGDCLRYGIDPSVAVSHEALEMLADPTINRVAPLFDGRNAAVEVCDPVESDDQGYLISAVKVSNFVLPSYFRLDPLAAGGPYDFRNRLTSPVPALTPGGYISIEDANGNWTQVTADLADGMASARALMRGFRRGVRARRLVLGG